MEKYLTLSLHKNLVFKDSLQFLDWRLATLTKNHFKTGLESFKHLSRMFIGVDAGEFFLLNCKGVKPSQLMDCSEKMHEQQLTPK